MQMARQFARFTTGKPAEWFAAFAVSADLQRRIALIALAIVLQSIMELPHDIVGALTGPLSGFVGPVLLAASLVLLVYALVAPAKPEIAVNTRFTKTVLILAALAGVMGVYQIGHAVVGSFTHTSYANDGTTLGQNAANLLLHGKDPYVASSMPAAIHDQQQYGDLTTPLRAGSLAHLSWLQYPNAATLRAILAAAPNYPASATPEIESHVSYPAFSFLPLVPFVWAGLPSVVLFTVLCLALFAWVAWRAVAPELRPWLVLLLLADVPLLEGVAIGESDIALMVLVFLAWLWWDRPIWSTVALGLALATKQQAWFFALFFAVFLIQRVGWRATAARFAGAIAIFFAVNAPFIIDNAQAWLTGIRAPQSDPMWPLGNGLIALARQQILPLWSQNVYTVLTLLCMGVALAWYARVGARRYPATALVLAMLPLWFNWRSLSTYFFFSALPMLILWLVWQHNAQHEKVAPSRQEGAATTLALAEERS